MFFLAWDAEVSWDDAEDGNPGAWVHPEFRQGEEGESPVSEIWHAVRKNPDFMMTFADRVYKQCSGEGPLADAVSIWRWQVLNDFIRDAVIAESARWGDGLQDGVLRTRDTHWQPEVARVAAMMEGNVARFIAALRAEGYYPSVDPPVFSHKGGMIPAKAKLKMETDNPEAEIYYRLDGGDPRLPGGDIAPEAERYQKGISLPLPCKVKARVRKGAEWSALQEASFLEEL
jgi:hypothetical protein